MIFLLVVSTFSVNNISRKFGGYEKKKRENESVFLMVLDHNRLLGFEYVRVSQSVPKKALGNSSTMWFSLVFQLVHLS